MKTIRDIIIEKVGENEAVGHADDEDYIKGYNAALADLRARAGELEEVVVKGLRIGFLRQWLNEDRITDPKRMVTNEQIEHMLGITSLRKPEEREDYKDK